METPIGVALKSNPRALWTTTVLAILIVGCDAGLVVGHNWELRHSLPTLAALIFALVASGMNDGASFGFQVAPRPGWDYWVWVTVAFGIVLFLILAATGGILFGILQHPLPPSPLVSTSQFWPQLFGMCLVAPLSEEVVYRLVICPAAVVWLGPSRCIVFNGVVFAGLHVLYGNPSPENLLGGFLLSWAFLKSGTILVPIVLHSLGNLCAFVAQVAYFYYLRG